MKKFGLLILTILILAGGFFLWQNQTKRVEAFEEVDDPTYYYPSKTCQKDTCRPCTTVEKCGDTPPTCTYQNKSWWWCLGSLTCTADGYERDNAQSYCEATALGCGTAVWDAFSNQCCGDDGNQDNWCHSNGSCVQGVWYSDHCSDGVQNCDETGIDCGGGDCPPVIAPTVTNLEVTNITYNSARLYGNLTNSGCEDPTIHIYWGDNDGGTNPAQWGQDENLGIKGAGTFYKDISGLNPNTTYYYRSYATNSAGSDWADSTFSFTTTPSPIPSGNITAPSSASVGQNFTPTLEATDNIGVKRIDLYYGGSWHTFNCPGGISCSHSWTIKEGTAGTYWYHANVFDTDGNASNWVCNGAARGTCHSDCQGLGYISGQNYSGDTFCGTNQCLCYRENPCPVKVVIE